MTYNSPSAGVHVLSDVRQILQHQHWVLDGLGILYDFAGHTMEHILETEGFERTKTGWRTEL